MLALVGSGEYLPDVDLMDRALIEHLPDPPRVVCLPTAAGQEGESVVESWMQKGVNHFTRLGAEVTALPVVDRTTAQNPDHAETIRQANFVYLSGGHPGYLHQSLEGSPVWEAILSVHQQGGVVAGCSAGAMIMGERILGPGGNRAGFNLLPGTVVVPHFDEWIGPLSQFMRFFSDRRLTMIGIDGRTALVVENGRVEVLGTKQVTFFTKEGRKRFSQGPIPAGVLPA